MTRVILTHLFTEYIFNRIIKEKCEDHERILATDRNRRGFRYGEKLTRLHGMKLLPDKLHHNLKELNKLRDGYAHYLELPEWAKQFSFYPSLDSDDKEIRNISEANFNNGVEWLCDTVFVDLANVAYDLKIDTRYKY